MALPLNVGYVSQYIYAHAHALALASILSRGLSTMNWKIEKKRHRQYFRYISLYVVVMVCVCVPKVTPVHCIVCFTFKFYARLNLGSLAAAAAAHILSLWELCSVDVVVLCLVLLCVRCASNCLDVPCSTVDSLDFVNERAPSTFSFSHFMTMLRECVWFSRFFFLSFNRAYSGTVYIIT